MAKSLGITILLALLVSGVGHIYLGFTNRGITILVIAIFLSITLSLFVPFPYSWIMAGAFWIWQMVDVYSHYKILRPNIDKFGT